MTKTMAMTMTMANTNLMR